METEDPAVLEVRRLLRELRTIIETIAVLAETVPGDSSLRNPYADRLAAIAGLCREVLR